MKNGTTCQHEGQPHDPLHPHELSHFRDWLARQPLDGKVSVFSVCRLVATLDAELGLARGSMGVSLWMQDLADAEFAEEVDF